MVLGIVTSIPFEGRVAELFKSSFRAVAEDTSRGVTVLRGINEGLSSHNDRVPDFECGTAGGDGDVSMFERDSDRILGIALIPCGLAAMALLGIWLRGSQSR